MAFSLFSTPIHSQNVIAAKELIVSGEILDSSSQTPLEYATVVFTSTINKNVVTGGITDAKGKYSIPVKTGEYTISFEFIGFKTSYISNKKITKNENLGTQFLEPDLEALDEVEIIAEKTTVEIKLDKKIYNVGKDLTVRGGTVSDVLDNVPSVSVDVEGNVALRGNDNVRILINGKPSGLVGLNSTEALRQLPAESIEKVEVITSPSARYDAEGTAGILNIILRRSKLQGLNGAITTNAGYNPAAGVSGNINYRTGNINLFNTSGVSYREVPGNSSAFTQYKSDGNFLEESSDFDRFRRGTNTNFGIEWYITNSTSITTSILYRNRNNENNTTNAINQLDSNQNLISNTTRFDPENENGETIQYAINFNKDFKTSGHKLTFDFQYEDSNESEISKIKVDGTNSENVATLEDQERILVQADYVQPIGEKAQFEMGFRGNFNTQITDYTVEIRDPISNIFVVNTDLTNLFEYGEELIAVYSQYGSKIGAFSYLLGLRLENTALTLNQVTTRDLNKKNFIGLFPTVNLNYKLNDSETITLAYNRRLRRPRSFFVNPFPSRSSVTNIFQGNPDLNPSFSGQFNLGYLRRFGKLTFDASTYYSRATEVFSFVNFDTGTTVTIANQEVPVIQRTPINLATQSRLGLEFTLSYRASKKWNINTNFNFFQNELSGITPNGLDLSNTNTSWQARIINKYTLPGKIDWQTRIIYRGPSANAQNKREGVFSTNLAFSKDLFKEKGALAINVSDLFNSRKRIQTTTTPTFNSNSEFQWRQRSFNLSFTYRFNQKKKRGNRKTNGSGGDFEFEG